MPIPHINDEFAYLLGSDTFAHFRATNPPHPLWQHFESIHIIQQPTYASKYPPAQSTALAVGQLLGHPIVGVWLSTAFACLAIYWMLLAWLPQRWALLGGLLIAMHPITLNWSYGYWGGAIAMSGGALLFGGFRRVIRDGRPRDAYAMGAGMLILANSRPYEGFILTLLIFVLLMAWALGSKGPKMDAFLKQIALPLTLSAIVIGVELGTYNYAVTGNPLQMPYMVHESTYGAAPFLALQKAKPAPVFRHKELRDLAMWYKADQANQHTPEGFAHAMMHKLHILGQGFLWSGFFAIPFLGLFAALRYDRWSQFALICCGTLLAALLMATWVHPHYAAPGFGPFIIVVIQSLRQLRLWRWKEKRCGLCLSRVLLLLCVATVPLVIFKLCTKNQPWASERDRIRLELMKTPGKHLVIVHYSDTHNPNREWVYNDADIDASKIAWARAMTPKEDNQLLEYFKGRHIWTVQADAPAPQLIPN